MKTNSKKFNDKAYKYILDAINPTDYKVDLKTEKEKLSFLAERFTNEYLNEYSLKRYKSYQGCLENWLRGLPSTFNIDFTNYEILNIARDWNEQDVFTEKQEERILENWFNLIAFKILQLFRKHNIKIEVKK